jgi:hypothetical protein
MPRSERQVPSLYFGKPGALLPLPWPRGDMEKPYDRQVFDFTTGSGQHAMSLMAQGARTLSVNWNALHIDTLVNVSQYWTGMNGAGPWALIDPSSPNLLLPNQAAATGLFNDATGFATTTGLTSAGTLLSSTTQIHRTTGTRSLRWQFTVAAAATPTLYLTSPYRNWFGVPVMVGLPYAWSVWARPDSVVDSSITMRASIEWKDAAGAVLSTTAGSNVVMSAGYVRVSVLGTAPASAAYANLLLVADGTTITTGGSIYVDEPLFEQDTVVNNWAPGTGSRAVEIMGLSEIAPFEARMRRNVTLTLRELAT